MGLLEKIFGSKETPAAQKSPTAIGYKTLTELNPVFTSYNGGIYEQELTRAVIQRFADACSKLKPEARGVEKMAGDGGDRATGMDRVQRLIKTMPNDMMTWPVFLSRVATMFEIDRSAFIVKSYAPDCVTMTGIYPVKCEYAEVLDIGGKPYIRFNFIASSPVVVPMSDVAIVSKFQYLSEFFGEENCLNSTMQLMHAQAEAQQAAIKNGAKIRFIGKLTGQVREEDIDKKRDRFIDSNFNSENTGGMILYDQTWEDIKQIEPQSYTMSSDEMQLINSNVFNYFGINEDILQNKYSEDTWGAWYEGRIEPFAVKLGEALTRLFYSKTQMIHGKRVEFSSNRLAYASNASKRNMVRDMTDRGITSINEGREILQLPPIENGDVRVIRGEYINVNAVAAMVQGGGYLPHIDNESDKDAGGNDKQYKDSDAYDEGDEDAI